ncbi:Shikimate kinase 3, chloroplastic [Ananas comosus]|uniref:shikimate kinase n=1 Tax=Ananas comosus TaxID=4615 RepID=A0A199V6B2_ANACO|nr:Shikimate kinase 3, chloroplastic [Ananas comosus]
MEASAALSLKSSSWIGSEKGGRRSEGFSRFQSGIWEKKRVQSLGLIDSRCHRVSIRSGKLEPKISCCYKKSGGTESIHNSVDEALVLKRKSEDVLPYLNGRCIYLVGMMGSGKTTVGKILSEVLGYSFFDRFVFLLELRQLSDDKLVEQAVGISSVAQIFKLHSEAFFRDNESEVLRDLSSMRRLVVATGGGAVIRPINWKYMKQGLTVWLDVPLEALARRIAAVGTASRPLLHQDSGDPYMKAFARLSALSEQRGDAYANADARVSLEHIATKQGHEDVSALTPTAIAIEAFVKIESFLTDKAAVRNSSLPSGMSA